jgi:hypothetical protein
VDEEGRRVTVPWPIRQARAEAAGLCVRCGGELDSESGCPGCVEAATVKVEARREEYVAGGLCRCGRGRAEGRKQCAGCLEWDRERLALRVRGTRPAIRPVAVQGGHQADEVRSTEQRLMDRGRANQGERT